MTPSEIISRFSPTERDEYLKAFLHIDKMSYAGIPRADRDVLQLAHYTDLNDLMVATANTSVENEQAIKAPAIVTVRHRAVGSGGVHTLRCRDQKTLQERAQALKAGIDSYRSPSISAPRVDAATGDHLVEVRYYGLN